MTSSELYIKAYRTLTLSSVLQFTKKMYYAMNKTSYIVGKHHEQICAALDDVVAGRTRKLIINIAPRYGKTLLVSQMFVAYGLAVNAKSKFLHLSYSADLTADNSLAVRDIVSSEAYQALYDCRVRFGSNRRDKWATIQGGVVYATSTMGQITGFGAGAVERKDEEFADAIAEGGSRFAGAIVIDDPIKPESAFSDTLREAVNRRFETTIRNRVNSRNTPIIIVMQRLHEHDLCGYLQEVEPDEWRVLSLPCIYEEGGREQPLWPFKQTLSELHELRRINPVVFETQYMQNPTPFEGLMYRPFATYEVIPNERKWRRCNYTDSADTGADYHCSINYVDAPDAMYVLSVLYTKKPHEYTEPTQATMLARDNIGTCYVESNGAGRAFARNVERLSREMGNNRTTFVAFVHSGNKEVRLFSRANEVNNLVRFPVGWERLWPEFARDVKAFRKEGRNAHDDAPDALTGMVEKHQTQGGLTGKELERMFL